MNASSANRRGEGPLLLFLAFGNFVIGMGAFVVIGIISPMAEGLHIPTADAGSVLTTYALAYAVLSPVAAATMGRIPRRTVLVAALAIFFLGTVLSALSTSLVMLASSRIVVALGASMFTPMAAGVAVAVSTPERRGKALALVFSGGTLAQVAGTPFGSWVSYHMGWAATFWVISILAAIGTVVTFLAVPGDVRYQASHLGAIVNVLRDRRAMLATSFTATFITALYVVFTFLGPLIEQSVGHNPEVRTGYLVLYGIGAIAGNYVGGILTDKIGGRNTLVVICLSQIVLLPLFSIVPMGPLPFAVAVCAWSAFSWSFMAPQQARLALFAPHAVSLILALNAAMIYIGIAIGSAAGSRILAWHGLAALGVAGGFVVILSLAHLLVSGVPGKGVVAGKNPQDRIP